jgi:hypothetical protein
VAKSTVVVPGTWSRRASARAEKFRRRLTVAATLCAASVAVAGCGGGQPVAATHTVTNDGTTQSTTTKTAKPSLTAAVENAVYANWLTITTSPSGVCWSSARSKRTASAVLGAVNAYLAEYRQFGQTAFRLVPGGPLRTMPELLREGAISLRRCDPAESLRLSNAVAGRTTPVAPAPPSAAARQQAVLASVRNGSFRVTDASVRTYMTAAQIGESTRTVSCVENSCTIAYDDYDPSNHPILNKIFGTTSTPETDLDMPMTQLFFALFSDPHLQRASVTSWIDLPTVGGKIVRWPALTVSCDRAADEQIDWSNVTPAGLRQLCSYSVLPDGAPK